MTPSLMAVGVTPCTFGPLVAPTSRVLPVEPELGAGPHTGSVMEPNWPLPGAPPVPQVDEVESVASVVPEREHPDSTASRPITRLIATTRRCVELTWIPPVDATSP